MLKKPRAGEQTDRQTDRQTHTHTEISIPEDTISASVFKASASGLSGPKIVATEIQTVKCFRTKKECIL